MSILRDLVIFGGVGIKVILAVIADFGGYFALEGQSGLAC